VGSITWGQELAEVYDAVYTSGSEPSVLDQMVDLLSDLALHVDGRQVQHSAPYRYVWPSELDLMARLTGLRLRARWAGWDRQSFTSDSTSQVAVFEKAPP